MKNSSSERRQWSSVARAFERVSAGYFAEATAPFFAFAGLRPGHRALDVACGPGTSSRLAAARVRPGGSVLGVDLSPAMLSLARRGARGAGWSLSFRAMDAEALTLPDASFDAVVCHLGVMLFARPERALAEMTRVLAPGGRLSCLVLGSDARMKFTNLVTELLPPPAPRLGRFAAPGALASAMRKAGLRSVVSKRLRGVFTVASAEAYWDIVTRAFGKIGPILRAMPAAERAAVKKALFARLRSYERKGRLELPYEFVMARGRK